MSLNPYAPPNPIEEPLDAIVLEEASTLSEKDKPVLQTLLRVSAITGALFVTDAAIKEPVARFGLLCLSVAGLGGTARLAERKSA